SGLAGAGAGFATALATGFALGVVLGFAAVDRLVARLAPDGFVDGRFAGARRFPAAAGFLLPAPLGAGFLGADLLRVAGRDLRAGFTCFLAMVILVR
ncbi:MAG TPA: hypothetical protein VF334_02820, partial [Polyangia bacterium]